MSIKALSAVSSMNTHAEGMLPSASRGPVQPASDVLSKAELASVMSRSQVLNAVSTPPMFEFLFGKPMLFRILCASAPVKMIVWLLSSGGLASMLYWVPFLYAVLLSQVLPPDEWFA
ncbi:hypothetical protein SCE1572_06365 [Sorangium cellulosum So0157-2]|uniref:Uncharacterized protein n=1 Tax=Sorangium cellulosum So0157-2 TaxID=1254432 RepID=S4XNL1_SORCE|nr:hypothetical protein SCE1572_06365 [Sorangium cellulosum So0157-2]